jgi:hypothetical protein
MVSAFKRGSEQKAKIIRNNDKTILTLKEIKI